MIVRVVYIQKWNPAFHFQILGNTVPLYLVLVQVKVHFCALQEMPLVLILPLVRHYTSPSRRIIFIERYNNRRYERKYDVHESICTYFYDKCAILMIVTYGLTFEKCKTHTYRETNKFFSYNIKTEFRSMHQLNNFWCYK